MQQDALFTESQTPQKSDGPVTCLGKTFANDAERRAYFTQLLAEKLKDPEFRKIDGFPIGTDEAILNLSDPPYYTACPNPWIADFIAQWEAEKPSQPEGYQYHREPFAADVSEGKNDPIYNAHSYHTKVPHKAIMRYILHYSNPGDIVFDGFCGTGMTGVAAQMCGDREEVMSLGYQIRPDGTILQKIEDEYGKEIWVEFSRLGSRKAILNDLSPAATFIAQNYNSKTDELAFKREANRILKEVETACGWMYETNHSNDLIGRINFTLWSDLFLCGHCNGELIFWDVAIDPDKGSVKDEFSCVHCNSQLSKRNITRVWDNHFDSAIGVAVKHAKQVPVLINYSFGGKRYEKRPDVDDLKRIEKITLESIKSWFPINEIPDGDKTGEPRRIGLVNAHHMYTVRNLSSLAMFHQKIFSESNKSKHLGLWFTSSQVWGTKQNRLLTSNYFKKKGGVIGQTLQGTLYISSLSIETNMIERFRLRISSVPYTAGNGVAVTETSSSTHKVFTPSNSLDYVFIDPPFGSNLMYSELNILWESWLKLRTNNRSEAIENKNQKKGADEYRDLMSDAFSEIYRTLKPGRWMTVEFSNTKAGIWNGIQSAITNAGFIVANVSALVKTHNGFNAVTNPTSVKQDLVISAYKPNGGFEDRFKGEAATEAGVWDFIRTHLQYLPVVKLQGNSLLQIPERDPRILFDQVVAYYVRKGFHLPVSSQEFQSGLAQRFVERDGMYFLDEQAAEHDKKKAVVGELVQISLFVKDEASAIQWLRQLIKLKPQVFSDINPLFMQQLSGWSKNEVQLDLRELLNQNFLCYDGKDEVPDQIHSYLSTNWKELRNLPKTATELKAKAKDRWYVPDPNKAGDLEKLRERSLLKEFEEYKTAKKKLKVLRIEAARVGFKKLFEAQEFASILDVAAKLPADVIAEDPVLLMYYDQAMMLTQTHSSEDW